MSSIYRREAVNTESDVEQKFIYKLFTNPVPNGLGYSDADILTKPNIKKILIDKGQNKKRYHPDYAIILNGIPSLIVEAKAPGENLEEAAREARLYATEINASYMSEFNPCRWLLVSDGENIRAYNWDSSEPVISVSANDLNPLNQGLEDLIKLVSKNSISISIEKSLKTITKNAKFYKPVYMLGGKSVINQTVGQNSFGSNVSLEYKYLFNPDEMNDREAIAKNAYVVSKRKQSHISPIDKLIRAAVPQSEVDAKYIENTERPNIIFDKLSNTAKFKNEICLLIGGVGSGKSTFTDYLRIVALPTSIKNSTEWINVNLNKAPLSKNIIYDWVVERCIESIQELHSDIDFDHIKTLKKIYARELYKIEKGRASLFAKESEKYNEIIYDELTALQNDKNKTLNEYMNYLYCGSNKLFVIVLDNCDKRNREDQLLMFEVATWLKQTFPCMIFLPLRDTTYDQYCNEPPLDTVINDLVFRVDPPLLERVIYARLNYALREIKNNDEKFYYYLPNGVKVECSRGEVGIYIKCIVLSLFQDNTFRRIVTGLAGRNIRKGLEIFLDFCKSGHIEEDLIFKIRQSKGDFKVPSHLISRILLKGNRKYYYDKESHIKNLFYSSNNDSLPDPFVRISILLWLKSRFREYGPNRTKGYHKVKELLRSLQILGHSQSRVLIELESLSSAGCINTETQTKKVTINDLVSIAPSGFVHLDILRNISYLSTISEDSLFRENQIAKKIADNITGRGKHKVNSHQADISNSRALVDYLYSYYNEYFVGTVKLADDVPNLTGLLDLMPLKQYVELKAEADEKYHVKNTHEENYPPGTDVVAQIVSVQNYGIFVEFDLYGTGLIHKSNFENVSRNFLENCEEGDWVNAQVIGYNTEHQRFQLKLLGN